jgi:hypothetical protein
VSHAKVKKIVLIMKETLWKPNLNLVKDASMIYLKFITTVIIVTEKKRKEASLSYYPLHIITTINQSINKCTIFVFAQLYYINTLRIFKTLRTLNVLI